MEAIQGYTTGPRQCNPLYHGKTIGYPAPPIRHGVPPLRVVLSMPRTTRPGTSCPRVPESGWHRYRATLK